MSQYEFGASPSVVRSLQIAGMVEAFAPLHDNVLALWRTSGFLGVTLAPLEPMRCYFGSGVCMYFAWMNMFTSWLVIPGIAGGALALHKSYSTYTVDDHPCIPFFSLLVVVWSVVFVRCWRFPDCGHAGRSLILLHFAALDIIWNVSLHHPTGYDLAELRRLR